MSGTLNHLPHIKRRDLVVSFFTLLLAYLFLSTTARHPQPALAQPTEPLRPTQPSAKMSNEEQSYIMVKPEGVQRGLVGEIIGRFEKRGYKIVALKMVHPTKEHVEKHYWEHGPQGPDGIEKGFFRTVVNHISSGPVVGFVIEGKDAVKTGRAMLGETNPLNSKPGTIRGDYALIMGRNICHGSDSVENAKKEIELWFPEGVTSYKLATQQWIYE